MQMAKKIHQNESEKRKKQKQKTTKKNTRYRDDLQCGDERKKMICQKTPIELSRYKRNRTLQR